MTQEQENQVNKQCAEAVREINFGKLLDESKLNQGIIRIIRDGEK